MEVLTPWGKHHVLAAHAPQIDIGVEPYVRWWGGVWREVTCIVDPATVLVVTNTNSAARPADRVFGPLGSGAGVWGAVGCWVVVWVVVVCWVVERMLGDVGPWCAAVRPPPPNLLHLWGKSKKMTPLAPSEKTKD